MRWDVWQVHSLENSIGSYLNNQKPTKDQIEKALTMPGGGQFRLDAGQMTDDGELALSQAYGLIKGNGKFLLENIAKKYRK